MARPRKNNAEYFSHDANMRSDRKIIALRAKYGLEGYAIRNMILETLAGAENFEIPYNSMEVELLAGDFGIDSNLFAEIISYMEKINLLQVHQQKLSCPKLVERLEPLLNKRKRYRDHAKKVSDNENSSPEPSGNVLDNQNEVLETETQVPETKSPQSKVQYSKGKHRKGKKRKHSRVFVRAGEKKLNLTKQQEQELIASYGESIVRKYQQKLLNYITSKGDPYDSHYHTLLVRFDKDNIRPKLQSHTTLHVEMQPLDPTKRAQVRKSLMQAKQKLMQHTCA